MANSEFKPESKPEQKVSSSSASSTLREASEKIRDTADRFSSEAGPKVREMMDQASDMAGDFYGRAQNWLQESNNRNIAMFAMIAAAGFLGFFVGRASSSDKISSDLRSY